ncbi:BNR/Asp-box repeat protein [Christiangramia gaetbulicola]|uniref:BNR/Asp-box repeat protein n=1 Tax=Christiangramia gaetbulicola TaxID=703340 RepID=A0A2T6AHP6_9FLAO|nr:oxidoreductase [Christiangramia gaetbulicola]PTX43322.1 BNR/Asp-box repeat protein [Christiangramia gaetbulicola]
MKKISFLLILLIIACKNDKQQTENAEATAESKPFESVEVEVILENDSLSIRAIEVMGNSLAFASNNGTYGLYNSASKTWKINNQSFDTIQPEFRAVASTSNDFFMLSVANPALLYKTGNTGNMELVYKEENEKVFYDSMAFWNDNEGIAMGDPVSNCISIIMTRNGGKSWSKLDCKDLPEAAEGEAAFAASNSNIAIVGDNAWILTGGMRSRILYSPDKGETWKIFESPIIQGEATTGGYSIDFYDENNGIIIGGDYTKPEANKANKAITKDGGKTWELIADGKEPGYKSSIRYVPNSNAQGVVATGFTGIHYSDDAGKNWKKLSNEGFFTLRFINDSVAYAAGKGRVTKLSFR